MRKACSESKAALAARATCFYAFFVGAVLLVVPTAWIGPLGLDALGVEGFTRIGGALLALVGCYYWAAADGEAQGCDMSSFYRATVVGRAALCAVLALLAVIGFGCAGTFVLAAMNGAGAVSMWSALRHSAQHGGQPQSPPGCTEGQ